MASPDINPFRRRHNTPPQDIPLQDLQGPAETYHPADGESSHQRTLSERGRRLFTRDGTRQGPALLRTSYSPLNGSPVPRQNPPALSLWPIDSDDTSYIGGRIEDIEDGELSPLADRHMFSEATIGLDLGLREEMSFSALPQRREDNLVGNRDSLDSFPDFYDDERNSGNVPPADNDTTPLTDRRYLQPVGMDIPLTPLGQRHDRSRKLSVHFSATPGSSSSARLGDDLAAAEEGRKSSIRSRGSSESRMSSLSPSSAESPLQRAGTVVRKMSQRVVNLSNEPEPPVPPSVRRRRSFKSKRSDDPSDGPEGTDMHDVSLDGSRSQNGIMPERPPQPPSHDDWVRHANPFRGKSMGIFPPDSPLRTWLCDFLIHPAIEPVILCLILLQTILLAVDSSTPYDPRGGAFSPQWSNLSILVLFVIYTIEIIVRIIVSGFILNPTEYSTINRGQGLRKGLRKWYQNLFALSTEVSSQPQRKRSLTEDPHNASVIRTFTGTSMNPRFRNDARHQQRVRLAHRAFLRHSFNRMDFLAVICYWINFLFSVFGEDINQHVYALRMLSSLRILRLLGLTNGTTVILRSLKKAAPLLLNVALLIGFFWLLFAIVGVQAFKSSLRRYCVWVDPTDPTNNYTSDQSGNFQFCGGSITESGVRLPWYNADMTTTNMSKGYLCPPNALCISSENPYNGTVSFDNIFQSLELVFVVMTANTYTDLMYYLTQSDYLIACLFFAAGIVIMTFWLLNLLIAVITSSFQVMREESQRSAFADQSTESEVVEEPKHQKNRMGQLYDRTHWAWITLIIYGIVVQCFRSATMGSGRTKFISVSETVVTILLLVELVLRYAVDWRHFFDTRTNWVDLFLVVTTIIIQIPPVHDSGQPYAWLTFFQIVRIYRVVLAVKWTRELIMLVLGNLSGLVNLIVFVFLLTFLVSIFASQLFRGSIPQYDEYENLIQITFYDIYNCFLGMYQVFSSENWTILLYNVQSYNDIFNTAWIGGVFFILWFILANFIVLNMFIAVIQENFDVPEDEKRVEQVKAFLQRKELGTSSHGTLSLTAVFKGRVGHRRQDPLDYGPAMMDQLLKEAVPDFVGDSVEAPQSSASFRRDIADLSRKEARLTLDLVYTGPLAAVRTYRDKVMKEVFNSGEPNPFYSRFKFSRTYGAINPRTMARQVVTAAEQRKRAQREYLARHPNYNKTLFIFGPDNPIRRLCMRLVGTGRGGDRMQGVAPSTPLWYAFSTFLYAIIVAMVLLACVTTPLYQRQYFATREYTARNWFVFTDLGFAAIFTMEAVIRVIADGFFFTPHAYYRSSWGLLDGIVLVTLWINVMTALLNEGAVSRAVGAFKALRALRLLNISDSARDTFHAVIVRGGWKVISAALVSLSLLIPFAVYGLNLFNGRMLGCNDIYSGIHNLTDCVNEWQSSPNGWDLLAPRQIANPYYNFDDFGNSLFILFQIVGQEGWVDVMWSAESITGYGLQPFRYSSKGNALFFVIFNLLGAVFVLTLFISVFMRNYTEQTGVAFLTAEQRSWMELRNRLRQVAPSKRPSSNENRIWWSKKCYNLAVRKTGRWQRSVTVVLLLHLLLLCMEFYPVVQAWDDTRTYIFLALTLFYLLNIGIRIVGLTWTRFRKSAWDVYSVVAVLGTSVVTVLVLIKPSAKLPEGAHVAFVQIHKLLLVSIVLLLIPRNNQLDQLFKTAAASFNAIANLLATWLVLFLVFAIAFTQTFGLTRFGTQENGNLNFRNVPKALIVLFRMSTGEGWNQIMADFARIVPPYCTPSTNFLDGDCGSEAWARALFIAWNILSMYIFVNMFISLIFENFSYVYQSSSGLPTVTRDELRRFKQAWAECDPDGTGYIHKEALPRLLSELSGVFEMRIYPAEYSRQAIMQDCKVESTTGSLPIMDDYKKPVEIDMKKLNERLSHMPIEEIRQRRRELNVFYQEVIHSANPDRGIGFTQLLMILAHYKIIKDNKSLRLEEFLRRRARLQMVEDDVRRAIVSNFLDMVYWKRRFRRSMLGKQEASRMTTVPQLVPEIFIEDEDDELAARASHVEKRPSLSVSIPSFDSAGDSHASGISPRDDSPSTTIFRNRAESGSPTRRAVSPQYGSPQLRGRISDVSADSRLGISRWGGYDGPPSPLGSDEGTYASERRVSDRTLSVQDEQRSRTGSNMGQGNVLEVLDNSAWGESLRRSMTRTRTRRGSNNGPP